MRSYRYKIFYSIIDEGTVEIVHVRHTSLAAVATRKLGHFSRLRRTHGTAGASEERP